jgi:autotransporter passenger strand-loop-strand repeat protein
MIQTIAAGTLETNISLGVQQILDVYGIGDGVTESALAEVNIYSGGTVISDLLEGANSVEYIYAGGLNKSGTLANGEEIVNGGVDSGSTMTGLSVQIVENGGKAYNLFASASKIQEAGSQEIYSGGTAYDTTVGDYEGQALSGGIAIGTTVDRGGVVGVDSGTLISALVNSGGSASMDGLGLNNTLNGGTMFVYSGGIEKSTIINQGGSQTISAGGSAIYTQLDGGVELVSSGGNEQNGTINTGGLLEVTSSGTAQAVTITNGGREIINSSGTANGASIAFGGTLQAEAGGIVLGTIDLQGTFITSDLSDRATFNLGSTSEVIFSNLYYYPGVTARITNDTLTVTDNGTTTTETLIGDYSNLTPIVKDVSLYGVDVVGITLVSTAPCFAVGTRILTPRGEIAVENLVIGDMVITKEGDDAPIKWIGKRKLDLSRHPHPEQAQPIFFEADCLADGVPSSELILSPDHALYLDGVLVPAKALVNGQNIRQLSWQTVTYCHIELEKHSIIFSENTPVETYLETGNRGAFENGTDALTLHPDLAQTMREEQSCAPFVETGPVVWAIRIRTLERYYSTYKSEQRRYNA